ncbi:GPI mannosyltransferase 2-like [Asterias rubens]|uniref:GPI mannosyltransferase 2-like n=1 Tax=Asterias rubens TaxID=7604 RepID=UPI001455ADEC|nr:GPI mannosyltransferase 2-like [Asterias rubens]
MECESVEVGAFLQIVLDYLIPDHPADAFHLDPECDPSLLDRAVQFVIGGWSKWDAAYFLHIAQYGYTEWHMFAFFPLFPVTVRFLADYVISPIQHMLFLNMSLYSCVLIAAVTLNIVAFICAAVLLYHLGVCVLHSERLAYHAALLFCINPASVFMTAAYTESLFAMISFAGMLSLQCNKLVLSILLFGLSALVRSNGVVSIGFLLYYLMKRHTKMLSNLWNVMNRNNRHKLQLICSVLRSECKHILVSFCLVPCFFIMLIPFALFQMYSFLVICTDVTSIFYWMERELISHGAPTWCSNTRLLPYAAIQSHHWNVGFLKYYELKQIPNFLLALPMIILCVSAIMDYCKQRRKYVSFLGILETNAINCERRKNVNFVDHQVEGFCSDQSLVYMAHVTSLLIFGVTCMHVQVITRLIASSCPVVYWYAAHLTLPSINSKTDSTSNDRSACHTTKGLTDKRTILLGEFVRCNNHCYIKQLVLGFFLGYFILGLCMHCNYLPWT